ncbi:hypothetical protein UCDDA912_g01766 [Diaporthe ampelina]|uniref:Uncharacterized protein n=1 Tax=Diaporthe ampelina TaxID=1214573 RepID=A0A0G2HUJ7_9PEZI|nr:hypothetical protein UCDDA912_g01766 [Diaporthe ampelina]
MAETGQARGWDLDSGLEKMVYGSLELDLVVKPGQSTYVLVRTGVKLREINHLNLYLSLDPFKQKEDIPEVAKGAPTIADQPRQVLTIPFGTV